MRTHLIDTSVQSLVKSFGVRPRITEAPLEKLFAARDYVGMVRLIKSDICKDARIRVGLINSGGSENHPASVEMPNPMPLYGTHEFKRTLITMYIRKSFLNRCTFAAAARAISHELSHIILDSIGHPLKQSEEAVDLTSMILGYRRLHVVTAERTVETQVPLPKFTESPLGWIKGMLLPETEITVRTLGYLSKAESEYAYRMIEHIGAAMRGTESQRRP